VNVNERSERTIEHSVSGHSSDEGGLQKHCEGDHCVTCSDEAVAVRVLRLRDGDLADVDVGDGRTEEVSVALVDAAVGDTVLVHAKEAIGLVPRP
jgi:hypothetical protein